MSQVESDMPAAHEAAVSLINYVIGRTCILPSEYYQAFKMFDEVYDSTDIVRGRDARNDYDIGRVGNHFVVMNRPAAGTPGHHPDCTYKSESSNFRVRGYKSVISLFICDVEFIEPPIQPLSTIELVADRGSEPSDFSTPATMHQYLKISRNSPLLRTFRIW